jgi:hypothetical protein
VPITNLAIGEVDKSVTPVLDSSLDWGRFFDEVTSKLGRG